MLPFLPPPPQVSEVTLNHLLRQALLSSAARCDDEDTLERLRAKKEPGAGAREVCLTGFDQG